jgi:hypothetical protein
LIKDLDRLLHGIGYQMKPMIAVPTHAFASVKRAVPVCQWQGSGNFIEWRHP